MTGEKGNTVNSLGINSLVFIDKGIFGSTIFIGTRIHYMYRSFFYITFLTAFLMPVLGADTIFIDGTSSYHIIFKEKLTHKLKSKIKRNGSKTPTILLNQYGFFLITDSIFDTTRIYANTRCFVDTVICESVYPFSIDSIQQLSLPFAYDAKLIDQLVLKTLRWFALRGYPFASVSLLLDFVNENVEKDFLNITFSINEGNFARFAKAIFPDSLKTNKKQLYQDIVYSTGEPFNIKKVEYSQKRLSKKSYVLSAMTSDPLVVITSDTTADSLICDTFDVVAVPFMITDHSGLGADGALAYNSEYEKPITGVVSLSLLNILHRGEYFSVDYKLNAEKQSFALKFAKPYPFSVPILFGCSFGMEIESGFYGLLKGEAEFLIQTHNIWEVGVIINSQETTIEENDGSMSWLSIGVDLLLRRRIGLLYQGILDRGLSIKSGTAIVTKNNLRFTRGKIEFLASLHKPTFRKQGIYTTFITKTILIQSGDEIHQAEKIRIGGHKSLRGYAEDQFAFSAIAYFQAEYLFFFNHDGMIYLFCDGGIGFTDAIDIIDEKRTDLFGYGMGIRIPVKQGQLAIEWARHYEEKNSLGRLHLRIQNNLRIGSK